MGKSIDFILHTPHLRILNTRRYVKKMIMVVADLIALPLALWSGFALRLADLWPDAYLTEALWLFILTPVLGIFIFMRLGLYRAVVRFMGAQAIVAVAKGVTLLAMLLWGAAQVLDVSVLPRSVPIIFALVALVYVGGTRLLVRNYYHWLLKHYVERSPVLIYGAGGSGVQLSTALSSGGEYLPVGFLDDDSAFWGGTVNGLPVYNPSDLELLLEEHYISHILLALPGISNARRKHILEKVAELPVHVKTMPSMPQIISGKSVDDLREIDIEDLLGRDEVCPDHDLLEKSITDKAVLVTGAGGSIGSEICRQIVKTKPSLLVLYEMSEFSLYSIEKELNTGLSMSGGNIPIFPILGSVLDQKRVFNVIKHFSIDTIYHAAAYKHVPMVEHNILEGVANNVFGTKAIAEAAKEADVERFVLISTDKAVRPTNVMGATKRLAELILQDMACTSTSTYFSMVRFGNVLGSSGSVVPLFQDQIKSGGPVTVTHPDITRFFMTIPEAAQLVIQAGSMAHGGDVFVLDMGEPVKIVNLASKLIQLMGLQVKSDESPEGIEIRFTGLRPGEKLYEELLIGENVTGTSHSKIMRANEEMLEREDLTRLLDCLQQAVLSNDSNLARELLEESVSGYKPSSPIADWLLVNSEGSSLH
ncbi:MAG: polysaccharide biosynthesis protein [Cellvibrionaceae bacterium]|nr:polysaccharide biosynthesis protein [Cellvibrionaceae bacterium]